MPTIPSSLVPRPDPIVAGRDPALAMLRAVACMVGGDGTSPVAWRREGLRWDEVEHVDLDEIAAWTAGHYRTDRSYPGAVIGSPNGAMAQLCALTRMPWLPQTMTVPVQWSSSRSPTAEQALRAGAGTAAAIVERNPAVRVHQVHGDHVVPWPGHRVSSFRCKQLRLPPAYTTFLDEVLAPGAPVLVLADESPWPVTTVSEHHLFQIGCRRAQAVEERAHGRRAGSVLPGVLPRRQQGDVAAVGEPRPDSLAPEAEWGLDPELTDDVARWAHRTGHPLRHIRIPGPHALAASVSDLHRNRARSCGQPDTTLTVSTAAPLMARTAGHVPYWVAPPLRQALTGLTAYLADAGYDAVEVRLHPVGDRNPGYREWHRLLECAERITFPPNRPALGDAEEVPEALPAPDVTEVLDALRESSAAAGYRSAIDGYPPGMSFSAHFVGTATTVLRIGGFTLLTDPNFLHRGQLAYLGYGLASRRRTQPALAPSQLPSLDAVVLSHLHGDHFDRVARRELDRDLPILTTPHAARRLGKWGFASSQALRTWESHTMRRDDETLTVTSLPGVHAFGLMGRLLPPVMGSMLEYTPASGDHPLRVYLSGDTLMNDQLWAIREAYPEIDIALLHLGGTRVLGTLVTMDGRQGVDLLELLRPECALPVHYDDYGVFRSPLSAFREEVQRREPSSRIQYLDRGETYQLPEVPSR